MIVESGGDNLAATFSPELADRTIYVIDVAEGDKIPRKGGPGITRSDLLVINKIDLAPHVGADLEVMRRDSREDARRAAVPAHQPAHRRGRGGDAAMGADAARITAADFVTPPEFRGLRLSANEAGRIGGVRLELLDGAGGTTLGSCYQQVPLRVLPPFRFARRSPALLYLLNPTAGLLDGDGQLVHLTARAGTRAVVVGQSATRIHPCPTGFATQQWHVQVEAGAALVVLPGPSIPFAGCRYYQRVMVDLDEGANFVWGDIGLAGRYARGAASERFRFETLVQECQVRRAGPLVFRDRFCWRGPWDDASAAWHFGRGTAWGSLFATGPATGTSGARFTTAAGDTCVRWVGAGEQVTRDVVGAALQLAARLAGGQVEDWTFHDGLAPVHWFAAQ